MFEDTSMFGYQSSNPVDRAVYDMMVMQEMGIFDADTKKGELNEGRPVLFPEVERRGW